MSSNDSLLAKDLTAELEAALLGDFPFLKNGSSDAQHFALAFSSQAGQAWWKEIEPHGLLGVAARAVSSERRGEAAAARDSYQLVVAGRGWVRLLGRLLEGWSQAIDDPQPIWIATEEVRRLRRSERKARLLAKLSVFAADKGEVGLARTLWKEAIDASSEETQLGRGLRIEGINLGVEDAGVELLSTPPPGRDDKLVFPEQLDDLQLKAARGALSESLEDRLGGPWRYTIRMGTRPVDDINTAHAQATWMGLPWLRRPIRRQAGLQLLTGAAENPAQWAHGVLMWVLGDGRQCELALRYAEPHFDRDSADFVVRGVGKCDPTRGRFQRLASLGSEAWDLVSDDVLRWLAQEIRPMAGDGSPAPESRMIWAAFAVRLTNEWFERYQELEPKVRSALLDHLNPSSLEHFSDEMKEAMYEALEGDDVLLAENGALLPLAAEMVPPSERDRLKHLIESRPIRTSVVAYLMEAHPKLITAKAKSRVLSSLRNAAMKQSKEARKGSVSLGGPGPRLELGRILSLVETPDRRLIDLLLDIATDAAAPPQYVNEARRGLVLMRRNGRLKASDARRLRAAPNHVGQGPFDEGLTEAVLRMRLLQVLADRTTKAERAELVSAVRSPEERVRDLAVNSCAEALQTTDDEGLAWAVVSGLFDPSDVVASGALAGLKPLTESFPSAADVAWRRLPELFSSSNREVRGHIVDAVVAVSPRTRNQKDRKRAILARARQDRSWAVRSRL